MTAPIKLIYDKYAEGKLSRFEALRLLGELSEQGSPEIAAHPAFRTELPVAESAPGPMVMCPVWNAVSFREGAGQSPGATERVVVIGASPAHNKALAGIHGNASALRLNGISSLDEIGAKLKEPGSIDHLVWFFSHSDAISLTGEAILERQEEGVLLLYRTVKALLSSGYGERALCWTIITTGTLAVRATDPTNPVHAGVHGLAGSLAKEFPQWKIRLLDLEADADIPSFKEIFSLPPDARGESLVRRGKEWFRRTAIPVRGLERGKTLYRAGGVYVVIGGAGGLGEIWSRWMVSRHQAQIFWIGRRPMDAAIRAKLDGLEGSVRYVQADASDRAELTRAYSEIRNRHPRIHGVIHAAVGLFDDSIAKMDEAAFRIILSAKIDVSVRIAQVFDKEDLDFVLFFSSVASFGKRGGMAGYSAGCFFKDCYAHQLSLTWKCKVKVINWGYWNAGTGNAISDKLKLRFAQSGVRALEPEEGMAALDLLLTGPVDQLAVLKLVNPDALEGMNVDEWTAHSGNPLPSLSGNIQRHLPLRGEAIRKLGSTGPFRDERMADFHCRLLLASLQTMGLFVDGPRAGLGTSAEAAIVPLYERWLEESRSVLLEKGYLRLDEFQRLTAPRIDLAAMGRDWKRARATWDLEPASRGFVNLSEACLRALPSILTGKRRATDVMFPNSSMALVEDLYKGNPAIGFFNEVLAASVAAYIKERVEQDPSTLIRILEVGAGTGASTARILPLLQPWQQNIKEYVYTDLSKSFLFHAEEQYLSTSPFIRTALFDVEKPLGSQGIETGGFDIVIAANVVHATRNIRVSLRNAKAALRNRGVIFLNELAGKSLFTHLTFGLLEGWWLNEDEGLRIQGSPALAPESWKRALEDEGFRTVTFFIKEAHELGGLVVAAESDGIVRQQTSSKDAFAGSGNTSRGGATAHAPTRSAVPRSELRQRSIGYFKTIFGQALHMETSRIDAAEPLGNYGIDSILIVQITDRLRAEFGDVDSTLLFEHQTIDAIVEHFVDTRSDTLIRLFGLEENEPPQPEPAPAAPLIPEQARRVTHDQPVASVSSIRTAGSSVDGIAIIGISGRYGGAEDPEAFWENLKSGKDCVTEIPADRWPMEGFYHPVPDEATARGMSYSKWGSFVDGARDFDPLFFNISPYEAIRMDPHERLFLECAWKALEDAGYTRESLETQHRREVGVFAGITRIGFDLYGPDLWRQGDQLHLRTSFSSVCNRVSYFLNLRGPSIPIDTMCSSSLTAVHEACEQIRRGACEVAIAGGVNLCLHPSSFVGLCSLKMLSKEGRCRSFGSGGDGFVPGEGVGAIVLKPLARAIEDHDQIYAVIKASRVNHGGKTNGYTVPNPRAQAELIRGVLDDAGVNARAVSYIEAHGTGTELGDPIEVKGLAEAFSKDTEDTGFCAIGSVKSNLGHLEAAAGIAGLTKVILQLKHGQLSPSLHAQKPNPKIAFERTPFTLQQELSDWQRPTITIEGEARESARIAGISSFGAGGSNAHVLIEEFIENEDRRRRSHGHGPSIVVLSARDAERLRELADQLYNFLGRNASVELTDLAYTLQVGREAMEARIGLVVSSIAELKASLAAYASGKEADGLHRGEVKRDKGVLTALAEDDDMAKTIGAWIEKRKYSKLLDLWVKGFRIDWNRLYPEAKPFRISLPTYPFRRERYWVPEIKSESSPPVQETLHPLLHRNTSDFRAQRFSTKLSGKEPFLADHLIHGKPILPAVAYLEMARAAFQLSAGPAEESQGIRLRNIVWARPLEAPDQTVEVSIELTVEETGEATFEIYSGENLNGAAAVHSQGTASLFPVDDFVPLIDLTGLQDRLSDVQFGSEECYAAFDSIGVRYGPAHRGIVRLYVGEDEVLARLALPASARDTREKFELHPSLMDAAFQAYLGLGLRSGIGSLQFALPFALEQLDVFSSGAATMWAWIRRVGRGPAGIGLEKINIDLCKDDGRVAVRMAGLALRSIDGVLPATGAIGTLRCHPVWQTKAASAPAVLPAYCRHVVLLCALPASTGHITVENAVSISLRPEHERLDLLYEDVALRTFEVIRDLLREKPKGDILVQCLTPARGPGRLLTGLAGLLKAAAQENPTIRGQIIEVEAAPQTPSLRDIILENSRCPDDTHVRYLNGRRQVVAWQDLTGSAESVRIPWKSRGVYVITGGAGGLGLIFAREIAQRCDGAAIILAGRSGLSEEKKKELESIGGARLRVLYREVDCSSEDAVQDFIGSIRAEFGSINGILHSAGLIRDSFILRKTIDEFREVLAPKVTGAVLLDRATQDLDLDFFVLFSSGAGVLGNAGQSDYATANAFLDAFAEYRNGLVSENKRKGTTVSIDWPLWKAGGMGIDALTARTLGERTGIVAMESSSGIDSLYIALAAGISQCLVMEGELTRLSSFLPEGRFARIPQPSIDKESAPEVNAALADPEDFEEKVVHYFRTLLSSTLTLPAHRIRADDPFEKYGIDSIMVMQLTNQLEKVFGSLSKTLFFEYRTIQELVAYFIESFGDKLRDLLQVEAPATKDQRSIDWAGAVKSAVPMKTLRARAALPRGRTPFAPDSAALDIAIVGLAGRYPQAGDLETYWENLRSGKDCITEVPPDRWDWRDFEIRRKGSPGSRWGGFIDGVDKFDPGFFNISPREAIFMDPQERIFLQTAWAALEDAGYRREDLQKLSVSSSPAQVGVYVGLMYAEYQLYGASETTHGNPLALSGSYAGVANRVSYFLDVHGPSMTVDTMCSSSLTSLHLACQDLKLGRTDLGIAGGVNVSVHPNKYLMLSNGQFLSSRGRCESFGADGEGYIPGEGCGAAIVKRLADALRDGDHIYGVIRSSALNHGGKTNSYSVPNPNQQQDVVARALREASVDPARIGYLEAHGTGTKLGDPIEITGLKKAFEQISRERPVNGSHGEHAKCWIGSVKSNIGHCESAAGIAGLTKVLLQMKHRQIVPSLHSSVLNPHIDFSSTPFEVNQKLRRWHALVVDGREVPRLAGISSFGAGGSNAHLIIEEYIEEPVSNRQEPHRDEPVIVVLSARDKDRLQESTANLRRFLDRNPATDLFDLAYTLQVGREAMEERLAITAQSKEDLLKKLDAAIDGSDGQEGIFRGHVKRSVDALAHFAADEELRNAIEIWFERKKYSRLADMWSKGLTLDWNRLYTDSKPRRISVPGYAFAKERYWFEQTTREPASPGNVLHPLLHQNTSDVSELRFSSVFSGREFFLADHLIDGQRVLPGAAYLEMARAAVDKASVEPLEDRRNIRFENVVWSRPIVLTADPVTVHIALFHTDTGDLSFEIYTNEQSGERIVHAQGAAIVGAVTRVADGDLPGMQSRIGRHRFSAEDCYQRLKIMGADYGPAHQGIAELFTSDGEVLAKLSLPESIRRSSDSYILHPAILDSALQASIGLALDAGDETPGALSIPFTLDSLQIVKPCVPSMRVWIRRSGQTRAGDAIQKLDLDLYDERGNLCVAIRGLSSRLAEADAGESVRQGLLMCKPVWKQIAISGAATGPQFASRLVMAVGLTQIPAKAIEALGVSYVALPSAPDSAIEQWFNVLSVQVFGAIKSILEKKPAAHQLLQVVVAAERANELTAGLSGLLKTAHRENPNLRCQLIEVGPAEPETSLIEKIEQNVRHPEDDHIRYSSGERRVLSWEEIPLSAQAVSSPWKDGGVYLITGGTGRLGLIFAEEIASKTNHAIVVLTGRGALSPVHLDRIHALQSAGTRVQYRIADVCRREDVRQCVRDLIEEHGKIDGILHTAGIIRDNFIIRKSVSEFEDVLGPKVSGLVYLDEETRTVDLDFFVLFSSAAGALGNPGQADYATANAFMDAYADYRNALVSQGKRKGRMISIDWPLWQEGGMGVDAETSRIMRATAGMVPLGTSKGVQALSQALVSHQPRIMVMEGDLRRLRAHLVNDRDSKETIPFKKHPPERSPQTDLAPDSFDERAADYFKALISSTLKLPVQRIQTDDPFERYGIDSVMAMEWTNRLEEVFGSLPKTLFFEYQTIQDLCRYFKAAHGDKLRELLRSEHRNDVMELPAAVQADPGRAPGRGSSRAPFVVNNPRPSPATGALDIAIIGLAGRYPQARNLTAFWENLREGKDCITEVPDDRWDWRRYYSEDGSDTRGHLSKWGGFVDDVAAFDPLFFNISPREAEILDPQERLFLETVWTALEDAGCRREDLQGPRGREFRGQVGVYAGVMYAEYPFLGVEETLRGHPVALSGNYASIANRVSYFLDLHGPSMTVDTMCSSSLTCIHLACQDLRHRAIDFAIAGGVNVSIHPNKYLMLSRGRFISSGGHCESFGAGGDGYVPGEGVGVALLKRLDDAERDGDRIYGVIRGSAINHDGKTNGYSVPNPVAQQHVIRRALEEAGVDPERIGYIEAHGTGTRLGDPIEIAGLTRAFREYTKANQFCRIGSVKSNIGHCESAAGIAGLTKVLLQLEHRQIVPSLHADTLNPYIDFAATPFEVSRELCDWPAPPQGHQSLPRIAAISSFGAGGANAHLVIEEYVASKPHRGGVAVDPDAQQIVVLSAKNADRLREMARNLARYIEENSGVRLIDLAYTLQAGREPMDERLGLIVTSLVDLGQKLSRFGAGEDEVEGLLRGSLKRAGGAASLFTEDDEEFDAAIQSCIRKRRYSRILELWLNGVVIDWKRLHENADPRRIGLPTYPFSRGRYWPRQSVPFSTERNGTGASVQKTAPGVNGSANETPSIHNEWLFAEEKWRPEPLPAESDWKGQLKLKEGQRIAIVYADARERNTLCTMLDDLQGAAGLNSAFKVQSIPCDRMATLKAFEPSPQTVFLLASGSPEDVVSHAFHLSKGLMTQAWGQPVTIYCFYRGATAARLHGEALAGFAKSAVLEHDQHRWRLVGNYDESDPAAACQLLLREWLADDVNALVREARYENSERSVCQLSETSLPWDSATAPGFRMNGVYLVAGGFGPVGELLCHELAARFHPTLLLLSRRPLDARTQKQCDELRRLGAKVHYFSVDIADRSALGHIYSRLKAAASNIIHGVIHLARHVEDAPIISKSWDSFQSVMRAKVQGTINLDDITAGEGLDFFMLFSSMASFGIRGSSDYAYSSAFQNAFARHRNRLRDSGTRSGVSISQCWGGWAADTYSSVERDRNLGSAGFDLIGMAQAFPIIEASTRSVEPVLGIMLVHDSVKARTSLCLKHADGAGAKNVAERLIELESETERPTVADVSRAISIGDVEMMTPDMVERTFALLFPGNSHSGQLAIASEVSDGVPAVIRDVLASVLKLEEVEDGQAFQNYGLESISAMVFSTKLSKELKLDVQPEWLIEFPTVCSLAAHIRRQMETAAV